MVPRDDASVHVFTACSGEIIPGNSSLVHVGLDVKDFIASNIEKLASIDYDDLKRDKSGTNIGKLSVNMLIRNPYLMPDKIAERTIDRLQNMVENGDFVLQNDDDIDYKRYRCRRRKRE